MSDEFEFDDAEVERIEGELIVLAVRAPAGGVDVTVDLDSLDSLEECGVLLNALARQIAAAGAELGRWPEEDALERIRYSFDKAWNDADNPGANTLLA